MVHVPNFAFSEDYALLVDLLVRARKNAGMSQVELAAKLGRPQPFISYIERGERRIDVIEFYAIMKALNADPESAFSELVHKLPDQVRI